MKKIGEAKIGKETLIFLLEEPLRRMEKSIYIRKRRFVRGYVKYIPRKDYVMLTDIYVQKTFRNRGYASSLLYTALKLENKSEAHAVAMESSKKFYLKIGFEMSDFFDDYLIGKMEEVEKYVIQKGIRIVIYQ